MKLLRHLELLLRSDRVLNCLSMEITELPLTDVRFRIFLITKFNVMEELHYLNVFRRLRIFIKFQL